MTARGGVLVVVFGVLGLPGQDLPDEGVVERVEAQVRAELDGQGTPDAAVIEQALSGLEVLLGAPGAARERACQFLQKLLQRTSPTESGLRWRLAALRLLGMLADDASWASFVVETALEGGPGSLRGLGFLVERTLGSLRSPAAVQALIGRLEERPGRAELLLVLGGLARLERAELEGLLAPASGRLLAFATADDAEVASRAVAVLGRIDRPSVMPAILAAARSPDVLVRLAAVRALRRKIAWPGIVALLGRLLEDDRALVREEAVLALRAAPDQAAVPRLVARLEKEPLRIRVEINATLRALTGFDFGPAHEPWEGWLVSARAAGLPEGGTRDPSARPPAYARPPRYYDIPVLTDRMLFVLDVSGSMDYSVGENSKAPSRIDRAKEELASVLSALDPRSRFNILFFNDDVAAWRPGGLVSATPRNVAEATKTVRGLMPRGGTNSYGALEAAFQAFPDIDTVYFLSDGVPSTGRSTVPERIVQKVYEWNRARGIRCHAVALLAGDLLNPFLRRREDKEEAARFMRLLAEETGGTFILIE